MKKILIAGSMNNAEVYEKPLINALGVNYKNILTKEKVFEIFRSL